jgi:hypothetical protein
MNLDNADRELIEGTISDLNESIVQLEVKRDGLTAEIESKVARRTAWQKRLAQLESDLNGPIGERPPRNLKGANLRAIKTYLQNKVTGVTQAQIQRDTNLAWSSVRNVLKDRTVFVEEEGLWRLRSPVKNPHLVANGAVSNSEDNYDESIEIEN